MAAGESPVLRALRSQLVSELEADATLYSPEWRRAVEAVPRHVFLPEFFRDAPGTDGVTEYTWVSRDRDPDEWLRLCYENKTWVTQLDQGATTSTGSPVRGVPTSSSTLPGSVVRMLEDLDVGDGMSVFQAGGGSDYSTALLCERLGDSLVTRAEYDPALSDLGRERLASLGHRPRAVTGDAAAGCPDGAPYDRVIATYSPTHIPAAWLEQSAPRGVVLASLVGSLGAYGYARVRVESPELARGRFIDSTVSFMPDRDTSTPEVGPLLRPAVDERQGAEGVLSNISPAMLSVPSLMWAVQLRLAGTLTVGLSLNGVPGRWFLHPDGSWAALEPSLGGTAHVFQGGPRNLWFVIEAAVSEWFGAGCPELGRYGLTVTPDENAVWLDHPSRRIGTLEPGLPGRT
ncbi:methyltransferase [Streptomyces sp. NPDC005374]|uniref:methyltransferase n=1 Tax=Streptomyces sp. NPDC005374 TaxID=3364713 RepID=UPI003694DAB8